VIPTVVPGSNRRYILLLTVVSALILVVGALTRPRNEPPAPTSDADLALISRLSERRSLENMTSYFSDIASAAELSLVHLHGLPVSAVAWDARRIVTSRVTDPFPASVTFDTPNGEMTATTALRRPDIPVVAIGAPPGAAIVPVRRSSVPVQSGAWITASWTGAQPHTFAYGRVLDIAARRCDAVEVQELIPTFMLTGSMAGGGIFDIDGYLIGLVVTCGDGMMAVAAESLDALIDAGESVETQVLSSYGLRAAEMTEEEAAYARIAKGLMVRDVWTNYAAQQADVRPGDVILAIDDAPVTGAGDLQRLVDRQGDGPPHLTIERGSARIDVLLQPPDQAATADAGTPPARGLTLDPAEGIRVEAIVQGSPAAAADIRAGDRIVRIDRVAPESRDQVRRLLAGSRGRLGPVLVELERGSRRFVVLLQPPA